MAAHVVKYLTKCYECATLVEEPCRGAIAYALCARHKNCKPCPLLDWRQKQARALVDLEHEHNATTQTQQTRPTN